VVELLCGREVVIPAAASDVRAGYWLGRITK
jgi:hypothetical protein